VGNLSVSHNSGFFSCSSVALRQLIEYFNFNMSLPEHFDRSHQYLNYKTEDSIDLSKIYFCGENDSNISYNRNVSFTNEDREDQFSNYKNINFEDIIPFIRRYFWPSQIIQDRIDFFVKKYDIDLQNTCAVFYRGNDKSTETKIAPYEHFISKTKKVLEGNPNLKLFLQTDEIEFMEEFMSHFSNRATYLQEVDMMGKNGNGCVFYNIPKERRYQNGIDYLSAVVMVSRCSHVITHSGNGGMWSVLYRGNAERVYQVLYDEWI